MGKHINKPPRLPEEGDRPGYRVPPKDHRWKSGQSGNPKGRPKGSNGLKTDLTAELKEPSSITINGEVHSGTRQQVMIRALAMRAVLGDVKAAAILFPIILQTLGIEDRNIDARRLSAADEELLERLLARRVAEAAPAVRRRNRRGRGQADARQGEAAGEKTSTKARKKRNNGKNEGSAKPSNRRRRRGEGPNGPEGCDG